MESLINDKELTNYVETHKEEIKDYIEKKAKTVIKQELTSAFRTEAPYYDRKEGYARKIIREKAEKQIKLAVAKMDFPIDDEALQDKLEKSVNRQLKKVKAKVRVEM